jgi:hypothetical protein
MSAPLGIDGRLHRRLLHMDTKKLGRFLRQNQDKTIRAISLGFSTAEK